MKTALLGIGLLTVGITLMVIGLLLNDFIMVIGILCVILSMVTAIFTKSYAYHKEERNYKNYTSDTGSGYYHDK